MKKTSLNLLLALAVLNGCTSDPIEKGETCAIRISGIEFAKSLNHLSARGTVQFLKNFH